MIKGRPAGPSLLVLALAMVWLASNLAKPLTIDDAAYFRFASQMSVAPADPYGFTIFWYQSPQPAIEVLAPPVWLYWWATGIRVLGTHEWAWKLWQFPFLCLFVASFLALGRRFTPGPMAGPLVVLAVLSPVFLPGLNLMLDVPAASLALGALVLFLRASDRGSTGGAVLAGLVAGLAIQTKYTGVLIPLVMAAHAIPRGRFRLALAAGLAAAALVACWEATVFWRYGQSQLLGALLEPGGGPARWSSNARGLITLVGGVGSAWGVLALVALGARTRLVAGLMLASAAAFIGLGWLPERIYVRLPDLLAGAFGREGVHLNPALDLYRATGVFVIASTGVVVARLRRNGDREDHFLMAWLALEFAGYILVNPFVAARRLMGLAVVVTLLVGRLAGSALASAERRRLSSAVVVYGAAVAVLFAATDRADAVAQRDGALRAAATASAAAPARDARRWYVGHWGFQHYAELAGMEPVVPGVSALERGDLLVVPGAPVDAQRIIVPQACVLPVATIVIDDGLAWRTVPGYYRGAVPLAGRGGAPRLLVHVYRVTEPFIPAARLGRPAGSAGSPPFRLQ